MNQCFSLLAKNIGTQSKQVKEVSFECNVLLNLFDSEVTSEEEHT